MKLRVIGVAFLAGILVCALAVKQLLQQERVRQATDPTVLARSHRYAFSAAYAAIPFWSEPRKVWEELGKNSPAAHTEFGGPTSGDAAKQIEEIEQLISQKVDGIALFPGADPNALTPVINKAVAAGIPVVTAFADVPDSRRTSAVRAQEQESGELTMQSLLAAHPELLQSTTKILLSIANPSIDTQQKRITGLKNVIAQYPELELVATINDEIDENKGAEAIHAALVAHPDIRIIIGVDSRSAIGAIAALRELGKKPGDVLVTGWDSDADVLTAIADGWVYSTTVLPGNFMMELSFAALQAYYLNGSTPEAKSKALRDIPVTIDVPARVITRSNVQLFLSREH